VAALIVFTDGQATTGSSEKAIRQEKLKAARRGVAIYAVMVGDDTLPTNVGVVSLAARRTVIRGSPLILEARVSHRNLGGKKVTLRLMRREGPDKEWQEVGEPKTVPLVKGPDEDFPDDQRRSTGIQTEELTAETKEVGTFEYKAVVDTVGGERNTEDNACDPITVEVTDEKVNVLLVSGGGGWEFQYLRNLLLRQEDRFRVGVWQQNADENVNQLASTGMELMKLPSTLAELMGSEDDKDKPGYRVVILYDPQPSQAKDEKTRGMTPLATVLKEFVGRHGGGLCYIAGSKHTDALIDRDAAFKPLADMLPVVLRPNTINLSQRIAQRRPVSWPLRLTSYGIDHDVMSIGDADFPAKDIWPRLPGVYWSHPVNKIKMNARVLAESTNPQRRTSEDEPRPEPLVAVQPYGAGRVLYMGTDATWRWRFVADGKYHRRFWGNVVQYLASPRARRVIITAGGDEFDVGKEITIEVEAYDDEYKPLTEGTFDVEMIDAKTGERKTLVLKAVKGNPGKYKLSLVPKQPGKYLLSALWDMGREKRNRLVQSKEIKILIPKAEDKRPEARADLLRLLASSEENFLPIRDVDKLARLIRAEPLQTVREEKREIWELPDLLRLVLLTAVLLLSVEWVCRKAYNMT